MLLKWTMRKVVTKKHWLVLQYKSDKRTHLLISMEKCQKTTPKEAKETQLLIYHQRQSKFLIPALSDVSCDLSYNNM